MKDLNYDQVIKKKKKKRKKATFCWKSLEHSSDLSDQKQTTVKLKKKGLFRDTLVLCQSFILLCILPLTVACCVQLDAGCPFEACCEESGQTQTRSSLTHEQWCAAMINIRAVPYSDLIQLHTKIYWICICTVNCKYPNKQTTHTEFLNAQLNYKS